MNSNIYNNVANFVKKRTFELMGLLLIFSSLALTLSFITYSPNDPSFIYGGDGKTIKNFFGIYGGIISDFLLQSFGLIAFLIVGTLISWGFTLIIKKELKRIILKVFFIILYLVFGCTFIYMTFDKSYWLIDNGNSGFVGHVIYDFIYKYFPLIENRYSNLSLIFLTIVFFILASDININKIFSGLLRWLKSLFARKESKDEENIQSNEIADYQNIEEKKSQQSFIFEKKNIISDKKFKNKFRLPSIDLLKKNTSKINIMDLNKNRPDAEFMEKILLDFGISGNIKKINNGPVVSLYEFEPAPGVKVSKIINLSDDLARNTSSTSARVSIIPGKNTVGIEIPNDLREDVNLREIISSERFQKKDIKLPIALGKSISGIPIVGDLTSMPHLLIAGTTGSGKSVCINTIITSLLYKLNPDICKFVLIDPKMLELSSYEGIPHLLSPVITDAKKATSALGWAVKEMNSRYKLMSRLNQVIMLLLLGIGIQHTTPLILHAQKKILIHQDLCLLREKN